MQSLSIVEDIQLFLKGYKQYSEPYPVSHLIDTKAPSGDVIYMMARLHPGHKLPLFSLGMQFMLKNCYMLGGTVNIQSTQQQVDIFNLG